MSDYQISIVQPLMRTCIVDKLADLLPELFAALVKFSYSAIEPVAQVYLQEGQDLD